MLWGKLIDHDRCIGCHACSVACKVENQVPLGVFRTWVKQVEKGSDLSTRRHFGVLRCNQCDDAPCVGICPTQAMHRRPDGIVDFDPALCVGCKACILACPYDAIYIDPDQGTAAKCNFCAHRVEVGLEPACVSACPTGALQVSDLHDPASPVARAVAREAVSVRKPELGTHPKVFYKGADQSVLDPHAACRPPQGYWGGSRTVDPVARELEAREPAPGGPRLPGAPAAARVAYDVPREGQPWGGKVSAYLLAKGIGGGALLVGGVLTMLWGPDPLWIWPALLGILGIALATALLVADLKRPERFLLLLTRPHWNSWLVKGAWVLMGASTLAAVWGLLVVIKPGLPLWVWQLVGLGNALGGAAAAGYTAFLFGQARGRALWQSSLLLPHLLVQAALCGSAALSFLPGLLGQGRVAPEAWESRLLWLGAVLGVALVLDLVMILAELKAHGNEDARLAARWLTDGPQSGSLYLGVIALGHVFPAVALSAAFMLPEAAVAVPIAGAAALVGVALWDHLYVQAGQVPPLS